MLHIHVPSPIAPARASDMDGGREGRAMEMGEGSGGEISVEFKGCPVSLQEQEGVVASMSMRVSERESGVFWGDVCVIPCGDGDAMEPRIKVFFEVGKPLLIGVDNVKVKLLMLRD